jgi:ferredoxin
MPLADPPDARTVLTREGLARLVQQLIADGFRVVGPTVRDGAIVFGAITGLTDLPAGWTEVQEAGRYRLARRSDEALFGFASGPESLKRSFFAPHVTLLRARKKDGSFVVLDRPAPAAPLAIVGARSCDLHAVAVQDRILLEGAHRDEDYAERRAGTFVVAIDCTEPGGTCFCVAMGTGPKTTRGFDLALTELLDDHGHRFVVNAGSEAGARMLARLSAASTSASTEDRARADAAVERCASRMGRTLDTAGIKELLYANLEHPRWNDVADRCLACANCTLVCPTCFCATVEDRTDLAGESAERSRRWDSCFSLDHSHVHDGPVRASTRARYRQWLTHKLASWIDQFGTSGCVGCGRCITWCPVGIDITEEVAAIRELRRD